MDALFICLCCVYVLLCTIVIIGVFRHPSKDGSGQPELPSLSIIVPVRNEEQDLPRCLAALEALDYPRDRLEVLLVDDESTDGSATVIAAAVARNVHFKHLCTAGFASRLRVKARPVELAARCAVGDWLLITDADGAVKPQWARTMLSNIGPRDGVVAAPFVVAGSGLHGRLEALVSAFLMAFCFGLGVVGVTPPCIGPNMAIRRRAYLAGGGLNEDNFFIAEDIAIWRLAQSQGYATRAYATPDTTVVVTSTGSLGGTMAQHHRWLGGGLQDGPPGLKPVVAVATAVAWLATACVVAGAWTHTPVWLAAITARALVDLGMMWSVQRRCGVTLPLAWLGLLELYLTVGILLMPIVVCFSWRLAWRGNDYVEYFQPCSRPSYRG